MGNKIKKLPYALVVVVLIILLSSYTKGAIDGMGGEVRLEFYETIIELKDKAEILVEKRELISEIEYKEIYEVVSEYGPLRDEYEEDVAYKLFDVYKFVAVSSEVEGDRWIQANNALEELDKSLFLAGFDLE